MPSESSTLRTTLLVGVLAAAALTVFYVAGLVRLALSPNEPYADHIGLTLDQCVSAQPVLTPSEARAYCSRQIPKRQ